MAETMPKDKKVEKCYGLNKLTFVDLILFVHYKKATSKAAFDLIKNCEMVEYPEGNCHLTCDHFVERYKPNSSPMFLILKK